jgi:hypothetical protein
MCRGASWHLESALAGYTSHAGRGIGDAWSRTRHMFSRPYFRMALVCCEREREEGGGARMRQNSAFPLGWRGIRGGGLNTPAGRPVPASLLGKHAAAARAAGAKRAA